MHTLPQTPRKGGSESEFIVQKQIPLYFCNRWSQRLQIWHSSVVCQGPSWNPTRRKSGCRPRLAELPKIWGFPSIFTQWLKLATSNMVHSLGLPRPTIKPQIEKKWAWPRAREAPLYSIFLQQQHCPLSVSRGSCIFLLTQQLQLLC